MYNYINIRSDITFVEIEVFSNFYEFIRSHHTDQLICQWLVYGTKVSGLQEEFCICYCLFDNWLFDKNL